ncbi:MAG: cysteine--tRNA ligase [Bacteroidota bacterium]|jgi:cysteinyl-tRNA synthetase|nr:cysteine--tRNA ligase [Bacteroidota bacterium]
MNKLYITNSLSRQKEEFQPLNPPYVGMYVCGPTVSGESHLGHARPYVTFDVLYRWLMHLGYKVRYVRNITDAGHFEEEGREAEDKVGKKAKLEQLEPMELVQKYTNLYHDMMDELNCLRPSIEPTATGHIVEQIDMIQEIMHKGLAYVSNGSVYFDVIQYAKNNDYGRLSGRVLDEMISGSRDLDGQDEKRHSADFALWKNAPPEHIQRWNSPWGEGFPGWHIECSAMATKYLGAQFDIHGGGMDLQFPHHESEIAQSKTASGKEPVKYWMHNNMITINGRKMGKSYNNTITLRELFFGNHPELKQAFHPMVVRFFILQTQYRGTLDFSNEALMAAEKGFERLINTLASLHNLHHPGAITQGSQDQEFKNLSNALVEQMNDDLNTAQVIATLFELASRFNALKNLQTPWSVISEDIFNQTKSTFTFFINDILALKPSTLAAGDDNALDQTIQILIELRKEAKAKKDYATSDAIRNKLINAGIQLKDEKDGTVSWNKQ